MHKSKGPLIVVTIMIFLRGNLVRNWDKVIKLRFQIHALAPALETWKLLSAI